MSLLATPIASHSLFSQRTQNHGSRTTVTIITILGHILKIYVVIGTATCTTITSTLILVISPLLEATTVVEITLISTTVVVVVALVIVIVGRRSNISEGHDRLICPLS